MLKALLKKIGNLSIKYKLFLSCFALIIISLCLFLFINSITLAKEHEKQALYTAKQVLSQTKSFLEFKTTSARNSLDTMALNDTVQELLKKDPREYYDDIGLWPIDAARLNKVFFATKSNPDIEHVRLYMKHGPALVFSSEDFINLAEVENSPWYQNLAASKNIIEWYAKDCFPPNNTEKDYIYVTRKIPDTENLQESIGIIRLDIPKNLFATILDQAVFTETTSVFLVNNNDEIICSSREGILTPPSPQIVTDILSRLQAGGFYQETWDIFTLRNQKILVGADYIVNSDWRLLLVTPYDDIISLSVKSRKQMIVIFLIITPLAFPMAFYLAASATKRIKRLAQQMTKVVEGKFDPMTLDPENDDEIGKLTKNFNYMVTKMAVLVEEKYHLGKEIKNMELKALQAQINPHFLYNTLELINWMSVKYKAPRIGRVVNTLAKFYKLSLSKGEDWVTVENELAHVQAYVQIQNMRFEDKIRLDFDVPEALYQKRILKLILQPLVENAILHGILETPEEKGTIRITGRLAGKDLILHVQDDGVGMEEDKALNILNSDTPGDHHGYGIRNINDRIRLNYGVGYGLAFSSRPGEGTTVTVRIPAL